MAGDSGRDLATATGKIGGRLMHKASLVRTIFLIFLMILAGMALLFLAWAAYGVRFFNFERPPRVQQIALRDLNGNGFLDAVVGNRGADEIWFNDGLGNFSDSGQKLGNGLTRSLFLAELDGDGNLDLVVGGETGAQVWLNDGRGHFGQGQLIDHDRYAAIALGDVTGDGLVDIFIAEVSAYQVWRGEGNGRFRPEPRGSFD